MFNSQRAGVEPPLESNLLQSARGGLSVARGVADRQKKIRQVEQQLTASSCVETNSQTQ